MEAKGNVAETAEGERVEAKSNVVETATHGRGCRRKAM